MAVKYIGDGSEFYPGLQNADLTDEQWEALPEEVREMLVRRKMFEVIPAAKSKGKAEVTPKASVPMTENQEAKDGA
jgi:hypothetical protein